MLDISERYTLLNSRSGTTGYMGTPAKALDKADKADKVSNPTSAPNEPEESSHFRNTEADNDFEKQLAVAEKKAKEAVMREREATEKLRELEAEYKAQTERLKAEAQKAANNAHSATMEASLAADKVRKTEAWAQETEERASKVQVKLQKLEQQAATELRLLEDTNKTLIHQLEQSQLDVRQLLDQLTQSKVDGRWNPPDDNDIRDDLQVLYTKAKGWAKKWAVTDLKLDQRETKWLASFTKYLSRFVQMTPDGSFSPAISTPTPKMKDKVSALLLNAALMHEIQIHFFHKPFFVVPKHAKALEEIFSQLVKANHRDAHAWRCSLWRLYYPVQSRDATTDQLAMHEETTERLASYCHIVASKFLEDAATALLAESLSESENKSRQDNLGMILANAMSIARKLWTQRLHLESFDLADFQQRNLAFNIASPLMQAHPFSKVDAEDAAHNGRRILAVTRPGLLVYDEGDAKNDSDNGEPYRVFAKAVLWLDEPTVKT